jgi:hypothetical protein
MNYRTPEMHDLRASLSRAQVLEGAGYVLLVVLMVGALMLVVLGPFPEQVPALYLTAVVLGQFAAASRSSGWSSRSTP